MNQMERIIKQRIAQHGPVSLAEYMSLALCHPKYGYYVTRDPLGVDGDFTTAPEISQIFGELVAVWIIDKWKMIGAPEKFNLVECGPGRGTLMSDILRVVSKMPEFMSAVNVHMVEASPVLIEKQKESLLNYKDISWHYDFNEIPDDLPIIVIGNEFFDALPLEQLVMIDGKWVQKVISMDNEGAFGYGLREMPPGFELKSVEAKNEDIYEISPFRISFMRNVCSLVKKNRGAALFIDYGHFKSSVGDTLQAVKDHKYVDVLSEVGEVDITSHVDFEVLAKVAMDENLEDISLMTQRDFLLSLGLKERAAALMAIADEKQQEDMVAAVKRLSGKDKEDMGELFKVIEVLN